MKEATTKNASSYVTLVFFFKVFLRVLVVIYFWLHWGFVAAHGLSLVVVSGGHSPPWGAGCSLHMASPAAGLRLSSGGAHT